MGGIHDRHGCDRDNYREAHDFCDKGPAGFILKVIATDIQKRRTRGKVRVTVATGQRDRLIIAIRNRESARTTTFERLRLPGAMDCLGSWFDS